MIETTRSSRSLSNVVVLIGLALLSAGCGGGGGGGGSGGGSTGASGSGGSGSSVSTSVISGVAMDGYLSAAVAFYDLNDNGVLDSGEPSGNTNGSGQYSLTVNQGELGKHKVMLNAVAGQTVDSDNLSVPISVGYTLATTADHPEIISPLTTLTVAAMIGTPSLTSALAEVQVKSILGLSSATASLFQDFVKGTSTSSVLTMFANQAKVIRAEFQAAATANPKANPLDIINTTANNIRTQIASGRLDLSKVNVSTAIADTTAKSLVASATSTAGSSSGSGPQPTTPLVIVPHISIQLSPTTPTESGVFYAQPIVVQLLDQLGTAIVGVTPTATVNDNGWVIFDSQATSISGVITYHWAPGTSAAPTLTISYGGSTQVVTGTTIPWTTNPGYLQPTAWSNNPGSATGYQRDVTPQTDPTGTYYGVLYWDGGYTGIQTSNTGVHQLIFSAWDVAGHAKTTTTSAANSFCQPFTWEGNGIYCIQPYPWVTGNTYRFTMTMALASDGSYNDITVTLTDLSSNKALTIATLRQYGTPPQTFVASFAEDYTWLSPDCFNVPDRAATYDVPLYRSGATWIKLTSLQFTASDPTKYCAINTYKANSDGSITLYTGGSYQAQSVSNAITIH